MCDLRALVENKLDGAITESEIDQTEQYARRKLNWIISREGDSGGERLKLWYLVQLIVETIRQDRFSEICLICNEQMNIKIDCAAL